MTRLEQVRAAIVSCDRCVRLREYCQRIGREKRRAFRDDTYWARPVPGFGDPRARLLIVGLAPAALPRVRVVVALGRIAFDAYLRLLAGDGVDARPRPQFGHAAAYVLPGGRTLLGCYHPSRQNTNTGRLTSRMMDEVFSRARRHI